jgi:hypothetical protein
MGFENALADVKAFVEGSKVNLNKLKQKIIEINSNM